MPQLLFPQYAIEVIWFLVAWSGSCRRQAAGHRSGVVKHVTLREVTPSAI